MKRKYNNYKEISEVFDDSMVGVFMVFTTIIFLSVIYSMIYFQ